MKHPVRWYPSPRTRSLATAALLALVAAIVTGRAGLVLLAAPALGALALMPRRRPAGELDVDVALSGSRCFEGEDVTITATVRAPGGEPLDEVLRNPGLRRGPGGLRNPGLRRERGGPASRCGWGAWTARRPARRCETSACPSCPGPQTPNSTACSPPSASRPPASAARSPDWPVPQTAHEPHAPH
jgi:hypothetical protein